MSRTRTKSVVIPLALTAEQIVVLQAIRDSGHLVPTAPLLTVRPRFGVERAIVISGSGFSTSSAHIEVHGLGKLLSRFPISIKHVGFKKKFVCLMEADGWIAHVALFKPVRRKDKRLKTQIVSGGLPSLGKRSK